jgi:hypothetical protein
MKTVPAEERENDANYVEQKRKLFDQIRFENGAFNLQSPVAK